MKTYLKKYERKFPQFGKGNRHTETQEAQRVPKKLGPRRKTPRHIIVKMPKYLKIRENFKSSKRKAESYLQRSSHKTIR